MVTTHCLCHSGDMIAEWSTPIYSVEAVRAAERRALGHATDAELMDLAAHAVARACTQTLQRRGETMANSSVVILAGSGKNGGDALLAGVHLARAGATVTAVLCADTVHEPSLGDFTTAGGTAHRAGRDHDVAPCMRAVESATLVIDGIVGLGASPGLREPALTLVQHISRDAAVVAVDLPSGVDISTGELPEPHVRADATVTFSGLKPCHVLPPAAYACGDISVAQVGVSMDHAEPLTHLGRATAEDVQQLWPVPRPSDHKFSRGVLGVIAGSAPYPGAAVLAVSGAARTGVGMVRYVGPERVQNLVLSHRPETVCHTDALHAGRVQAWMVGSGVASDHAQDAAVAHALAAGVPLVVDAGAIEECVRRRVQLRDADSEPTPILTPHAGELCAALDALGTHVQREEVERRPVHYAKQVARGASAVVVLKGAITLVCSPDGAVVSQPSGPPWLATAGAGDVLAGVIGALLACRMTADEAAVLGVYVHATAAHAVSRGGPLVALDVAGAIPGVVATAMATRGRHS